MRSQQRRNRKRRSGMTLIEIMVVVIIIGMIASAIGVNVVGAAVDARRKQAQTDTATISSIADAYTVQHPSAPCPSVRDLREAHLLSSRTSDLDPWDHAYAVDCDAGEAHARSAGPDGVFDNEDDIF